MGYRFTGCLKLVVESHPSLLREDGGCGRPIRELWKGEGERGDKAGPPPPPSLHSIHRTVSDRPLKSAPTSSCFINVKKVSQRVQLYTTGSFKIPLAESP